ncbi:MAG: heme lyase CcmF/NrfE family subunit [Methylococcaceae bacterium]|nr:MAG: heme lyase CcmF/NrfE family subunit [Methylococcaceae bacterium]
MIAELGHFCLIMALLMAGVQALFPLWGAASGNALWMDLGKPAARAQSWLLTAAFACLVYGFAANDFSLAYVANNSNSSLPPYYRIAATWSAHEGSMLLWAVILGLWGVAVTLFSRTLSPAFLARVLGVMGLVSIGVLSFILFTSNPFERLVPAAPDGADLNPLLQDFGLTVHPPMLYIGYVGLSVAFAFAIAALLSGTLDAAWARWSRPWTLVAWVFLTLGITLGSWWAYYELGWGGWWFWDPVENASFMPWLVATALIHSLAVTEKRGAFKAWTVLLAIFAFSLSLMGMFLVRSGVLTSVHAFASDPARGLFILVFLGLTVGGSLLLYALKVPVVKDHVHYEFFSRENLLLLNNVLLLVAAASILLGTLYPLLLDALHLGKISVGPPYFSAVFAPVMAPVFLLAGVAPLFGWRSAPIGKIAVRLRWVAPGCLALGIALAALCFEPVKMAAMAAMVLALWLAATALLSFFSRVRLRASLWEGLRLQSASYYGMSIAHLGLAVFLLGVAVSSLYSQEKTVRMAVGDSERLGAFEFRFDGVDNVPGPNYVAAQGRFTVTKNQAVLTELRPEKRRYNVRGNTMTEAAIAPGLARDLYVALGESLGDGAWSVRIYQKPLIRCIWLGGLIMLLGGLLAACDRRYRIPGK